MQVDGGDGRAIGLEKASNGPGGGIDDHRHREEHFCCRRYGCIGLHSWPEGVLFDHGFGQSERRDKRGCKQRDNTAVHGGVGRDCPVYDARTQRSDQQAQLRTGGGNGRAPRKVEIGDAVDSGSGDVSHAQAAADTLEKASGEQERRAVSHHEQHAPCKRAYKRSAQDGPSPDSVRNAPAEQKRHDDASQVGKQHDGQVHVGKAELLLVSGVQRNRHRRRREQRDKRNCCDNEPAQTLCVRERCFAHTFLPLALLLPKRFFTNSVRHCDSANVLVQEGKRISRRAASEMLQKACAGVHVADALARFLHAFPPHRFESLLLETKTPPASQARRGSEITGGELGIPAPRFA